jgi:hypothetical protein
MSICAPLLAGLRAEHLRAILAHELAHYSNKDTRLAGIAYRGQRSMERLLSHLDPGKLVAAHEAEDRRVAAWKTECARKLDTLLRWLPGDGGRSTYARADRAYAALALVENESYDETVEQFRALGSHADNDLWGYFGKPVENFLTTRARACRGACVPESAEGLLSLRPAW